MNPASSGKPVVSGKRLSDKSANFILPSERFRPLRDQIIVKVEPLKLSQTIIADWQGEAVRGRVVAVGPGCYPNRHFRGKRDNKDFHTIKPSAVFRKTEVKVGDMVQLGGMEIGGYLFPHVQIDGEDHVIATEKDVTVIEDR
jgi:co-chaperonin GroES (HSP10)